MEANLIPKLIGKFFYLKGKPFIPYDQFVEPLFSPEEAINLTFKCGRQVSKTTSTLIHCFKKCLLWDHYNILFVLPLEKQVHRIASLFLIPIYTESLLPRLNPLPSTKKLVLHKFRNDSTIIMSYASYSVDRVRNVSADMTVIDEVQDMQNKFLPVIHAAATASRRRQHFHTGTPKTLNNTLAFLWGQSSQAEWCIKCEACNYWNIPSVKHDLIAMLGPLREDISEESPATICARCGRTIYPQKGKWIHARPQLRWEHAGYHVPQPIIPVHYASVTNWALLKRAQEGVSMDYTNFCREILGEAVDESTRLITLEELKRAAVLGPRTEEDRIIRTLDYYRLRVLGIDWGGGGAEGNYTTLALACLTSSGIIEIPWGISLKTPNAHVEEAREILKIAKKFKVDAIAHDYTGAGGLRETFLIHSGYPLERIVACRYTRFGAQGNAYRFIPGTAWNPRKRLHIDSTKCLLLTCGAIKMGQVRFFQMDYVSDLNPGLLYHFLALVEEMNDTGSAHPYRVVCEPGNRDEFAQATMLGCVGIWHLTRSWPSYALDLGVPEDD